MTHAAHHRAIRASIATQARELTEHVGTTLVAYMTGVRSRHMPTRWARGEAIPRAEASARLLAAYTAWTAISRSDGRDIARNWLVGANPWIGGMSPAEAIRNGDNRSVIAAAEAFLEDRGGA